MSGLHIGTDFRKFLNGKLPPLALVAIMLLPLLFGGLLCGRIGIHWAICTSCRLRW